MEQSFPTLKEPVYAICRGDDIFLLTDIKSVADHHISYNVRIVRIEEIGEYGKCKYWQLDSTHPFYTQSGINKICRINSTRKMECKHCVKYAVVGDNVVRS